MSISDIQEQVARRHHWMNSGFVTGQRTFFGFTGFQHFTTYPQFYAVGATQGLLNQEFQQTRFVDDSDGVIGIRAVYQRDVVDFAANGGDASGFIPTSVAAFCDSSGRLFTWGNVNNLVPINGLGHGLDDDVFTTNYSKTYRISPTQVFGENAELAEVHFVRCGAGIDGTSVSESAVQSYSITSGLASDGTLYMAGSNYRGMLGDGLYDPNVPLQSVSRSYHKPVPGHLFSTYSHGSNTMVAIDNDGNLWEWGGTANRLFTFQPSWSNGIGFRTTPFQIDNGFVDTVQVDDPGEPSSSTLRVSVSAPERGGQFASFQLTVSGGVLTQVRIREPGHGYDNPPTLTFSRSGSARLPQASCTLFSSKFEKCHSSQWYDGARQPRRNAISSDGYLYLWGAYGGLGTTPVRSPRRVSDTKFIKAVDDISGNLWAIAENGNLYFRSGSSVLGLPVLISSDQFVDIATSNFSVMVVRNDGTVFSQGLNLDGELGVGDLSSRSSLTQVAGNFKATKVFSGGVNCFVAVRQMSIDSDNNPVFPE